MITSKSFKEDPFKGLLPVLDTNKLAIAEYCRKNNKKVSSEIRRVC